MRCQCIRTNPRSAATRKSSKFWGMQIVCNGTETRVGAVRQWSEAAGKPSRSYSHYKRKDSTKFVRWGAEHSVWNWGVRKGPNPLIALLPNTGSTLHAGLLKRTPESQSLTSAKRGPNAHIGIWYYDSSDRQDAFLTYLHTFQWKQKTRCRTKFGGNQPVEAWGKGLRTAGWSNAAWLPGAWSIAGQPAETMHPLATIATSWGAGEASYLVRHGRRPLWGASRRPALAW